MESPKTSCCGGLWLRLLVFSLPFLVMAVLVTFFVDLPFQSSIAPAESFISEAEFSDGARVEILEGVAAKSLQQTGRKKPSRFKLLGGISGSEGGSYGGIDYSIRKKLGTVEVVELHHDRNNEGLILLMRVLDTEGIEVVPKYSFSVRDGLMEMKFGEDGFFERLDDVPPFSNPFPDPEYIIEVEDGGGGWIRMTGPVAMINGDGRAFAVTPIFPRSNPDLKIRVTRPGVDPPVLLTIPTPGRKTATPWTVDPKPWRRSLTDVDVEITGFRKFKTQRVYPYLNVDMDVKAPGQSDDAFYCTLTHIQDEMGNQASPHRFRVLPGTDKLRFHYNVGSTKHYLWEESAVTFLAEGKWTGKGKLTDLAILPAGENVDMEEAQLEEMGTDTWEIHFRAKGANAVVPHPFPGLIMFVNGEKSSSLRSVGSSGGSGSSGGERYFRRTFRWTHKISPGDTIRFGILPTYPIETFQITLPINAADYQPVPHKP